MTASSSARSGPFAIVSLPRPRPARGASACRGGLAQFLEALAVVRFRDNLDQRWNFVAVEAVPAKRAQAPFERLRVLGSEKRDLRRDHMSGDRILLCAYGRIHDVVQLQQDIL